MKPPDTALARPWRLELCVCSSSGLTGLRLRRSAIHGLGLRFGACHGPPELRGKCLGACRGERRGLSCGSRSFGESVEGRVTGSVAVQGLGFRELPEEPGGRGL